MSNKVAILMGSTSDWPAIKPATEILDSLEISYEVKVLSAHRTPKKLLEYVEEKIKEGSVKVFIAGAGGAAHLAGVISAHTILPVLGVPMESQSLKGLDSFIDVAKHIVPLFTKSSFKQEDVENILDHTWHDFTEKDLIKIIKLNDSISVLELFHGPTAAFKDFGLQLAAAFFNKTLEDQNRTAIVIFSTIKTLYFFYLVSIYRVWDIIILFML